MKTLFVILVTLILGCNLIIAQENLFEKTNANTFTQSIKEKIERYKTREALKQWEEVQLKPNTIISKNFKGIFNIFDKSLEFEITKDFGKDVNGVQGYKAELKDGGYAILSISDEGIQASVWYKESFYSIESIENGIYFVSEVDLNEIAKHENPNDYGSSTKLNRTSQNTSVTSTLSAATVKVLVAYTPAVLAAYNNDVNSLNQFINQCKNTTKDAFTNSLVSSTIELAYITQYNYSESGNSITDVNNFMNDNTIKSLRNQYEADECVLLVNTLTDGTNGQSASVGAQFPTAYCVVKTSAAVSNYSFPHELGHLFGCRHDTKNDDGTTVFNGQTYTYCHGNYYDLTYGGINGTYNTIMSVFGLSLPRIPYFTTPDVIISGVAIGDVIKHYCSAVIDATASTIAAYEPITTSGTISSNQWWAGNITITGSVTVNSGVTLTVDQGAVINFNPGVSLIINGTLNTVGSSTNGITFNRSGTTGTWGGIQFNSGSSGNLQYCTIQNATHGIYCYNSSPYISNCHIQNNQYNGIYCQYYSSPSLNTNTIQNNYGGILCSDHCSPIMLSNGSYPGYNVVRNNGSWGISASFYSNPVVGSGGTYGGLNSIYSNGGGGISAISATNNCTINAQKDWWNYTTSPYYSNTYFNRDSSSTISAYPGLSSDPNAGRAIVVGNDNQGTTATASLSIQGSDDDLSNALDKEKDRKYDEAIPLFLKVFKSSKDDLRGKYALSKIEECFTEAGRKDYQTYSNSEIKPFVKEGSETYALALDLETHQFVNAGLYKSAINNLLEIQQKNNVNNAIEKNTLFTLGSFYHLFLGDEINSDKYFDELKQKYPEDELVGQIGIIKNFSVVSSGYAQNAELMPTEETDKQNMGNSSVMISNYPNPFNPTTKISFSLPQKSQIKLKVFDVLGREIQILADGIYEAGKYEVEFSATNLPSGVYFYNLSDGTNSITKKMLLMK